MSEPPDLERQLAELRARVEQLESRLAGTPAAAPQPSAAAPVPPSAPAATPSPAPPAPAASMGDRIAAATTGGLPAPTATTLMATGAAAAFVLAAVYFVKLVYDAGWLTPERQLVVALLAGIGLIAGGLVLARHDRAYAAYLPAPGVVILYLTLYTGHLWYRMLGMEVVLAGVGGVSLVAVWLRRHFGRSVYALVAVAGAYSFPVLIPSQSSDLLEVVLYFAAWGLLFSWVSLQDGSRLVYLLALWLALMGFDIAWRTSDASDAWQLAAGFHFVQFLLFAVTAVVFSIRHRAPMDSIQALLHGAALFFFYGIEYVLIRSNAPDIAPFVALASAAIVLSLFLIARSAMSARGGPGASAVLVSAYVSWVTTHVLFFELLPGEYLPWAVLMLPLLPGALAPFVRDHPAALVPVRLASGVLFTVGLVMLLFAEPAGTGIPLPRVALFLYAAVLYVGARRQYLDQGRHGRPPALLYAGHLAFMVAAVNAFESGLTISLAWGIFAVALLLLALRTGDRVLGRSSLLIFAAFALKVLLIDLTGSPSLVRVGTLVVLGGSLYAGGWLYQRMGDPDDHDDEAATGSSRRIG